MRTAFARLVVLILFLLSAAPAWAEPAPTPIIEAEAAPAGWDSITPPATGWVSVALPDIWTTRWPAHDGVVWYRIRWREADPGTPTGLFVSYSSLASAIYVNSSLVGRDRRLVEPLSRSGMKPRYVLLSAPLLRPGENRLTIRVSGMAAYQPGLGAVTLGPADAVQAEFRQSLLLRYDTKLASLAAAGMLGCIFLLVWLMRRSDIVYGSFALFTFAASIYNLNFVVDSPWPFGSTHGWQALNASAHLLASISYALFLFRYEERHFPGVERWLGALCIGGMVLALAAAPWAGLYRNGYYMCSAVIYYSAVLWLARRAVHNWRADLGVLLACQIAPLIVSIHDFALLFGWLRGDNYLFSLTSMVTLFGSGFVLAYRFVAARRQVEGFNSELRREVDLATTTLGETLAREHRLALASTRADERLQIARDLHDGFGGTLIGAIARLEQTQQELPRAEVAGLLKGMRDDLRLLIDSTTHEQLDLVKLIAPLRHRSALLLEAAGIASRWHLENIDGVELDSKASLDLLRLLQEALTNVFKHSRAQRVDVWLSQSGGQVLLRVRDDGLGLDASGADKSAGTGLQSIKHRAERLGGRFQIASGAGHTELEVAFAIQ